MGEADHQCIEQQAGSSWQISDCQDWRRGDTKASKSQRCTAGETWPRSRHSPANFKSSGCFHCAGDHARKDCNTFQKVLESADINRGKPNGQWTIQPRYKNAYDKQRPPFRKKNAEAKVERKVDRMNSRNDGSDNESDDDESDLSDSDDEQKSSPVTPDSALPVTSKPSKMVGQRDMRTLINHANQKMDTNTVVHRSLGAMVWTMV